MKKNRRDKNRRKPRNYRDDAAMVAETIAVGAMIVFIIYAGMMAMAD